MPLLVFLRGREVVRVGASPLEVLVGAEEEEPETDWLDDLGLLEDDRFALDAGLSLIAAAELEVVPTFVLLPLLELTVLDPPAELVTVLAVDDTTADAGGVTPTETSSEQGVPAPLAIVKFEL